jgi:hypothetical protein
MTTYREEKDKQLAILATLKAVNADLKDIRPKLEAEKGFNKLNKTKFDDMQKVFNVAKCKQASILKELKTSNALLAELRGSKAPKVKDTSAAKAERDTAKAVKALEKAAKLVAKEQAKTDSKAKKDAERVRKAAKLTADREARAEELEAQGRSAKGYTIPLLSDKERSATTLLNKIAAEGKELTQEIAERKRVEHVASLIGE